MAIVVKRKNMFVHVPLDTVESSLLSMIVRLAYSDHAKEASRVEVSLLTVPRCLSKCPCTMACAHCAQPLCELRLHTSVGVVVRVGVER